MNLNKIIKKYEDEMIAEGAWSGHAYAPEYLSNIRNDLIAEFKRIADRYSYEKGFLYKDGKRCSEFYIYNRATHGKWILEDDYNALISEIYSMDIPTEKKYIIADALNDAFKAKLQVAIEDAIEILKDGNVQTIKI